MAGRSWAQARYGYEWRGPKKGPIERRVEVPLSMYFSGSVDEYIETLRKAAEGLTDPEVSMEVEYSSYDREHDYVAVIGWREATPEEIAEKEEEISVRENVAAERLANMEATLRRERPELFK